MDFVKPTPVPIGPAYVIRIRYTAADATPSARLVGPFADQWLADLWIGHQDAGHGYTYESVLLDNAPDPADFE